MFDLPRYTRYGDSSYEELFWRIYCIMIRREKDLFELSKSSRNWVFEFSRVYYINITVTFNFNAILLILCTAHAFLFLLKANYAFFPRIKKAFYLFIHLFIHSFMKVHQNISFLIDKRNRISVLKWSFVFLQKWTLKVRIIRGVSTGGG